MYRAVLGAEIYEVSSPAVAEMEKLLEAQIFNSAKMFQLDKPDLESLGIRPFS